AQDWRRPTESKRRTHPLTASPVDPKLRGDRKGPHPPSRRHAVLLGAHVSIAGGLRNAPIRAAEIDATAVQIFTKQANRWADPVLDPEQVAAFRVGMREAGVGFVCAHDSYLINLATPDPVLRDRSYA